MTTGLQARAFRIFVATAILHAGVVPGPAGSVCSYEAAERVVVGADSNVDGDIRANDPDGSVRIGRAVFVDDGTEVRASRVRLGRGSSVWDVRGESFDFASDASVRGVSGTGAPLDDAAFCDVPAADPCSGDDAVFAPSNVPTALDPGSFGNAVVRAGAAVELSDGAYRFCSLRLASGARMRIAGESATTIEVVNRLKLGARATLAPPGDGIAPVLTVHGASLRIGRRAHVHADLLAPAAHLRTGDLATYRGSFCARTATTGRRVEMGCDVGVCGDGVLDPVDEECDLSADGACLGRCLADCTCPLPEGPWRFTDVAAEAGVAVPYHADLTGRTGIEQELLSFSTGVAAGDYDGDGWVDLYVVGGDLSRNFLFRNDRDGGFDELAIESGVALPGTRGSGPSFADLDGDGWLDLVVGGQLGTLNAVFRNRRDGTFENVTVDAGLTSAFANIGSAFGDYDLDGDLDMFISHWGSTTGVGPPIEHLWNNDGDGTFTAATEDAELNLFDAIEFGFTWTFTPTFADLNGDGAPDLVVASDFSTEQYFLNDNDGTFTEATNAINTSENGMGSAVADYDNDGDLDWFISSIWDPNGVAEANWGVTGNRLYRNTSGGVFEDVTDHAGVREGYWGWGSCFADFDLDGHLDLFHVNGFNAGATVSAEYHDDPSRLFLNDGDGTFTERSLELGIDDRRQGRGVVCFDYDRDGDIDIFVANGEGDLASLFRNDGPSLGRYLSVKLEGAPPNTEAAGARVYASVGMTTQMREINIGNNFVSQNPAVAHFGFGDAESVDELRIVWPGGAETILQEVATDRYLTVTEP